MDTYSRRSISRSNFYKYQRWLITFFVFFISIIFLASFAIAKNINRSYYDFILTSVDSADLAIQKTINVKTVAVGKQLTYNIKINNKGPANAQNVVVTDTLPKELVYTSSTVNLGSVEVNGQTVKWLVGTLPKKTAENMQLTVTVVKAGSFKNKAKITSTTKTICKCNDKVTSTEVVAKDTSDVSIVKTVNKKLVNEGDTLSYFITISNNGPSPALKVKVKDILPTELSYEFSSNNNVSFDINTHQLAWEVDELPVGQSRSVAVKVKAVKVGTATNTAVVTSVATDPDLSNNVSTAEDVTINAKPKKADVSIIKSADKQFAPIETDFHYAFLIENKGPDTAKFIVLKDTLNEKTLYKDYKVDEGLLVYDSFYNSFIYTLDALPPGRQIIVTVGVKAIKTGSVINKAIIESQTEDPVLVNNTSIYYNKIVGLRIPNVFTPNGDNLNDTFQIEGLDTWAFNELKVMNRWGNSVYEKINYANNWGGDQLPPGTYYYVLTVKNEMADAQSITGWVAILRK
ncbi:gliding motility-associated C-terminal domain-containing protein [Solitalea sp. MAHUQ-68]|uniref:Gliding motility-associated C-terminal domain-containing protein n=1 Tax=Solitalea agri TaxID=2953739 RepID=A0A9X2JEA3_9SPHI|nr:gliding motility-associated C-terminal domain-containing protein [Solitalea agri]MCO4292166.1 gliding motility-associated C-terminal domain-containing protein [Solitalea agri]